MAIFSGLDFVLYVVTMIHRYRGYALQRVTIYDDLAKYPWNGRLQAWAHYSQITQFRSDRLHIGNIAIYYLLEFQ